MSFEWRSDEEARRPEAPSVEDATRRPRRSWLLAAGLLLLLGLVAAVVLRWRLQERQETMRADVARFVEYEERQRLFGLRDRVPDLVVPDAPEEWRDAYLSTFVAPTDPRPLDLAIEEISIEASGALVLLRLDGHPQARYYRLAGQGWRRAPIPLSFWGPVQETMPLPNGFTLAYFARDRAFAHALARDLPPLFDELLAWPRWNHRPIMTRIEIWPEEFRDALASDRGTHIRLVSPLLLPPGGELEPGAAVRLALAEALYHVVSPEIDPEPLVPGARRFLRAAQAVAAAQWALADEDQQRRVDAWRAQLGDEWVSPFAAGRIVGEGIASLAPPDPERAGAAAWLVAHSIAVEDGPAALAASVRRLPSARGWDELFQEAVGALTMAVEARAAAAARVPGAPRAEALAPWQRFPLWVEWLNLVSGDGEQFYVAGPEARYPVLLEMEEEAIASIEREAPLGCITPRSLLRLEGEWLEVGYRLKVDRATLRDLVLPAPLTPARPDAVAYVVEGGPEIGPPSVLVAVNRRGFKTRLAVLANDLGPFWLEGAVRREWSTALLFKLDLIGCDHQWILLFEPMRGGFERWLMAAGPRSAFAQPVWRPDRQDLLVFHDSRPRQGGIPYSVLSPGSSGVIRPHGYVPPFGLPVGWSAATGRAVLLNEAVRVGLLDLASQRTQWFDLAGSGAQLWPVISGDGRWLAYTAASAQGAPGATDLRLLDLTNGADSVVLEVGADHGFDRMTWSPVPGDDRLLVETHAITIAQQVRTRFSILHAAQPGEPIVAAETNPGEVVARPPLFCRDDHILYGIEHRQGFAVRFHPIGAPPETLLAADHPLWAAACP